MGLEWNNESNDQEDGNRGATWTNRRIYLEFLKTHCDLFCLVYDAHSFADNDRQIRYCNIEIKCPVLN